jgi:hypothetical protein
LNIKLFAGIKLVSRTTFAVGYARRRRQRQRAKTSGGDLASDKKPLAVPPTHGGGLSSENDEDEPCSAEKVF